MLKTKQNQKKTKPTLLKTKKTKTSKPQEYVQNVELLQFQNFGFP